MEYPLISVIVPTKNRQKYARKTVEQIINLNQNIEIVVHDNSDNDELYYTLKELISNNCIKYKYEEKELSFSENYNRAAEMATGEYLCAIGDDDGILPNISECALWMKKNNIDIVKPCKNQVYYYPENVNKKKNACVGIGSYSGNYYFSNTEVSVISLLDNGGCEYLRENLIGSYHGLVNMKCMKQVKSITGSYYDGLTPDMYSVVCLSLLPNIRFAVLDYPITLPGVCPQSGSATSAAGKHVGKLEDSPHLKAYPNYKWNDLVPKYYSVETIWAETMLYAIKKMGREELIDKYFNYNQLVLNLYKNNEEHRQNILEVVSKDTACYLVDALNDEQDESFKERLGSLLERASIKISGKRKVSRNIMDIREAVDVVYSEIRKKSFIAPWNH